LESSGSKAKKKGGGAKVKGKCKVSVVAERRINETFLGVGLEKMQYNNRK
jgi:hypothetical protein